MEVSSSQQMNVFLLYVLSGGLCGAFFDVQRFLRGKYKAGEARTFLEDLMFVLFCIVIMIGVSFFFNRGEIRYYQLMGFVSGVLFYIAVLSEPFIKILNVVFIIFMNLIIKPVKKIQKIIKIPIKAVLKLLKRLNNRRKRMVKCLTRHIKKRKNRMKKRIKML